MLYVCNDGRHLLINKWLLLAALGQKGAGLCFGEMGQRSPPYGQAGSRLDPTGPLIRCSRECLRPTPGRPVRLGHEASPHSAGAGARERKHKAQCQRTYVGRGGRIH